MARLGGYRGIAELTGLTLAAEVIDWRRFASARAFMGFTGLTCSEYSSGSRTRRGSITKAGPQAVRTALVEAAWAYRSRPRIGADLRRRQDGLPPATLARSWKAQQRLHATYAKMTARGKPPRRRGHRGRPRARRVRAGGDDQLTPPNRHRTKWRPLTGDEENAAVSELRKLVGGRADLLAEVADLFEGTSEGPAG